MPAKHLRGAIMLGLWAAAVTLVGQTVVGTGGGSTQTGDGGLSWTIGEPVIQTVQGGNAIITQGFQQPWADVFTLVQEGDGPAAEARVYPNPVDHILNIDIPTGTGLVRLLLLDAAGRAVLEAPARGGHTELDLTRFGTGSYYLHIMDERGIHSKTHKITINH